MKKIFAVLVIAASIAACTQNEKKETDSINTESTSTSPAENSGTSREQEIADSTKLLDKKLADPNDPATPDSLK